MITILALTKAIFTSVEDTKSMGDVWPSSPYNNLEIVAIRVQRDMVAYVIKVTEFNSEVICDL